MQVGLLLVSINIPDAGLAIDSEESKREKKLTESVVEDRNHHKYG
jgi:hypothetical protein